jgi:molybdopterin/thiamine biosynthesis adenylyltransferase/nitroreductase
VAADRPGPGWYRPEVLVDGDPAHATRVEELRRSPAVVVVDELQAQRAELGRLVPPPGPDVAGEPARWVHYPWRRGLVRLLGPAGFRRLRLDRNRNKITAAEQDRFAAVSVGVIGLSVGHAVAHTLALEGLAGRLRLADFDRVELSNLNRLPASVLDLGVNKAVAAARRIAELDPYLEVEIEPDGVRPGTLDRFLDGLDVVVEECDSLDVKVAVRLAAARRGIPVLMDTSDRGLLDVERFDLEPARPVFHGLLAGLPAAGLAGLSTRDKAPFVLRLLEPDRLSARLAASMAEIDHTVTTWPQLGGDVALGAAVVAAAVRRLGRGEPLASGRTRVDLDAHLDALAPPPLEDHRAAPAAPAPPWPDEVPTAVAHAANLAPSGGNVQPWALQVDGDGLRIRLRPERSSGMDIGYRGSLVAAGAALLNARVAAAARGRLGPWSVAATLDLGAPVAELRFGDTVDLDLAALAPALDRRHSNRHPSRPEGLDPAVVGPLVAEAAREGALVQVVADPARVTALAGVLGDADRLRFLTPRLHRELFAELRWPGRDRLDTGIDVRTLELDPADQAKLAVAARADVMAQLDAWGAGRALGDTTRDRVGSSPVLAVVTVEGTEPGNYVRGGAAVERLWLAAELAGVAVQPVSPLFLYAVDDAEVAALVAPHHRATVARLRSRFRDLAGLAPGEHPVLVLRLGRAPAVSARSARLDLGAALEHPHAATR